MRKVWFYLLLLSVVSSGAAQQKKKKSEDVTPQKDRPAADSHSFMELFAKLERDLVLAAQEKDRTSLDALVAAGFTERTAIDPEHPVARA